MPTKNKKEQIEMRDKMIADNLGRIKHRIVVFSGKGGVGKTTVSVNLAYGLQSKGNRTGLLDADVTGPNVPKLLGLNGQLFLHNDRIVPQEIYNIKSNPPGPEGTCTACGAPVVQRDDETEEAIMNRLETYNEKTAPLIGFYQKEGLLNNILSLSSKETVEAIKKAL